MIALKIGENVRTTSKSFFQIWCPHYFYVKGKTVLTRIISIVRVPSLCFNKDTHNNYDEELWCISLSVKLGCFIGLRTFDANLDERSHCLFWALWGVVHKLSSFLNFQGKYSFILTVKDMLTLWFCFCELFCLEIVTY